MAIKPICDLCKNELKDFGALLFSPPNDNIVEKYHICKYCYKNFEKQIKNGTK